MFKSKTLDYTPVSNVFIDSFMAKARGEYVKVYLLGLKYCISGEIGASSSLIASALSLLETDVLNAWNYWNDEGVIKLTPIDNIGNYNVEFLDLTNIPQENQRPINLLKELDNSLVKARISLSSKVSLLDTPKYLLYCQFIFIFLEKSLLAVSFAFIV